MKIRFLVFILALIMFYPDSFGQRRRRSNTDLHFGILAGINLQTFKGTDYWGEKLGNKLIPGFHGGGNIILPIIPDLYFQPGILFSVKGTRQDIIADNITKTVHLAYIEVPLNVLYRPQFGDGYILVGLGPYMSYGITGRERVKTGTITTELKIRYMADASEEPTAYVYYRGLDAGVNIFAGYELYNNIFCHLNAQLGLLKVNSDYGLPNDRTSKKNRGFGLSVGYRF